MKNDYCNYVLDQLSALPGLHARAMFGGYGIYREGTIFAIIVDDTLFFKVGPLNLSKYEKAGSSPFTYEAKGKSKSVSMSYWLVPAEILEDAGKMTEWAEDAYRVSLAGKKTKPSTKTSRSESKTAKPSTKASKPESKTTKPSTKTSKPRAKSRQSG
ncbi:MAG TPA: TfoX/Sxy family protein [Candidatus Obscuribacter sp.]|nr:TfoX/Sxy family protein [Candidatus Obscuribacter sp.]